MPGSEPKPIRRRAILDAASKLCQHYGHAKMTIADIAREASIAVGSVYKEFDSKESIIEELSTAAHARVLDSMQRAARKRMDDAITARFTAVLAARTATFLELREEGQHACELFHCRAGGVEAAHERFRSDERALFRQLIEDGQAAGEVGDLEPREASALVQRAFMSLAPPYLFKAPDDAPRATVALCQLVLHGLLVRNGRRRR